MIKINLFPIRQARQREKGKQHLAIGVGVLSVIAAILVVFHGLQTGENNSKRQKVARLRTQLESLKSELGDYDQIKAMRSDLMRQREALQKLAANRGGPTFLMRELSDVLSVGKGPTYDRTEYEERLRRDPNAGFNANWDTRRLWIRDFQERNHEVTMHGNARSSDDVAEFTRRLKLSPFFSDVYWQQTTPASDGPNQITYVGFDLRCRVNY